MPRLWKVSKAFCGRAKMSTTENRAKLEQIAVLCLLCQLCRSLPQSIGCLM